MMVEYVLAHGGDAHWVGRLVRAVVFTAAGVALLVIGVRRRVARARWDRGDDRRLLHSNGPAASEEHRAPAPKSGASWIIAVGAVLAVLGLLHILDLVANLHVLGVI